MGGNHDSNLQAGLLPAAGGGGFSIPWWVYLIVILIGVGLSAFLFVNYAAARRRATIPPPPGVMPAGDGSGLLIGAIACIVLLVVTPLILMLVLKPGQGDWIVGRWSQTPGCMGDTVEFTRDGTVIADGERSPYRLEGDQISTDRRTMTIQHDGDQFTIQGRTFTRCN